MFKPRPRFRFSFRRRKKSTTKKQTRKRTGPLPFQQVFLVSLVIFAVLTIWGLVFINQGLEPIILKYAKTKMEDLSTEAINRGLKKKVAEILDVEELFITRENNKGEIEFISFNPVVLNKVSAVSTLNVQQYVNDIEKGKSTNRTMDDETSIINGNYTEKRGVFKVPLGAATNNALLANLGPQIPVRLRFIGNVETTMIERRETLGINFVSIRNYLRVSVEMRLIVPFATETDTVTTDVYLGGYVKEGDVPLYYGEAGDEKAPSILLPNKRNTGN